METTQVLIEKNVPCELRDGTILRADIYRPNKEGKYPVLLTRLPYNKDLPRYSQMILDPVKAANKGYIVVIQDVRGRFQSEGEFQSFSSEAKDGYDTVEWAAKLSDSTGKVGMYGISYFGYTQWLAAVEQPPHLEAVFPMMTFNDMRNGSLFHNGAYEFGLMLSWTLGTIAPDLLVKRYGYTQELAEALQKYAGSVNHIEELFRYTPINDWTPLKELDVAEFFFEQFRHRLDDPLWEDTSIAEKYEKLDLPAYHLGGWYDCFLEPTIKNFTGMKKKAPGEQVRNNQKLIIGPWAHGTFTPVIGERSFGVQASGDWINLREDLTTLQLRWFDYWLKGIDTKITEEAPLKLFVMGINQWRDEQEWPLARTSYTPFYLHSGGKANTRHGDGGLSASKPGNQAPDRFVYDPENPVPTKGGGTLHAGVLTMGPRDQRDIEERKDVLVYTSEPFRQQLEVTGPVTVKLWAATDAKDTDFTAKLVDVLPDGTAYNLTDGIVRAKYRNGYSAEPELSGEVVEYEINLWATSNVFLPGHCIRIEVSSSNFPRFDRNPNTGETTIDSTEMKRAVQTIFHDDTHPSHIILPIIPSEVKE